MNSMTNMTQELAAPEAEVGHISLGSHVNWESMLHICFYWFNNGQVS